MHNYHKIVKLNQYDYAIRNGLSRKTQHRATDNSPQQSTLLEIVTLRTDVSLPRSTAHQGDVPDWNLVDEQDL